LSRASDRKQYFDEIERERYRVEWHIPLVANFAAYRGCDVLEIGCGIGTDGAQFAKHGARYTGIDLTPASIALARERFACYGLEGVLEVANAENLPFADASFDHVYSFGVIHHSPNPAAIVREIYRVLRPGGTFCVMVYNRSSINYYVEIMFLKKLFRYLLYPSFAPKLLARLAGFDYMMLHRQREIILTERHMTKERWLSMNTDGPDNPLSFVFNRHEVLSLFRDFEAVSTEVWHLSERSWIGRALPRFLRDWLGRHWGWHRMIYGRKPA